MTRRFFVTALLAAALAAGLVTDVARAGDDENDHSERDHGDDENDRSEWDHDDAWSARQGGSILPLAEVLVMVRPQIDGKIIEIEFEYEQGRPVYEFKYVDRNGRVRELYADARTGVTVKDNPD